MAWQYNSGVDTLRTPSPSHCLIRIEYSKSRVDAKICAVAVSESILHVASICCGCENASDAVSRGWNF
jgi:hypothetical protein